MRIVVTGRHGQIVSALLERGAAYDADVVAIGRPDLDLADPVTIRDVLTGVGADAIVSAAAYTAVDKAESDEALAFRVNAEGPAALAEIAKNIGIPIIHLSTDYVFSGKKNGFYSEMDPTGPLSAYGRSKLAGEQALSATHPNHVILRTSWVYSPFGHNFLKAMLKASESRDVVNVVTDQCGAPTSALDLAGGIITMAKRLSIDLDPKLRGIFHLTGSGEASWADFAELIFTHLHDLTGRSIIVNRISSVEYPTAAPRPLNSRLSNEKIRETYGVVLPDWRQSVKMTLNRLCDLRFATSGLPKEHG